MRFVKNNAASRFGVYLDIIEAIQERRSVRAFLDKTVSKETIQAIFEVARFAPSGVNHQPWRACVLSERLRKNLGDAILAARNANIPQNPDYAYYPKEWVEPYKSRRKACGNALYGALNIEYGDNEKRLEQWNKNYYFFHAPVGIILYLEDRLEMGSWMDVGGFIQTLLLAARGFGLETCPQAALAEYPGIVREHLQLPPSFQIVCGIAMGYADWNAPVNQYRTDREPLDVFVDWKD